MPKQSEFAGFSQGLEPLPDETLFSWCSRYHRLTANGHDRSTSIQLFGHHRAGTAHDFPARLNVLAARLEGALGTAADIIGQRTLLPFYLPFRSALLGREAQQALCGYGIGHIKYRLGLLTSGLGAAHPLKACPSCIRFDLSQYGWTYWHRTHQLPGIWLCPLHRTPLDVSPMKLNQVARCSWALPIRASCEAVACLSGPSAHGHSDWLLKLGDLCSSVINCAPGRFDDPVRIGLVFKHRLTTLGLTHSTGRIRWLSAEPVLDQVATHLAGLPELCHQADTVLLRSQFLRLLAGRALTHPLRYLVWIAAWFDDLDGFQRAYANTEAAAMQVTPSVCNAFPNRCALSPLQQEVLLQAVSGCISLTAAAKTAGVDYATIAAWVSRQAVQPPRRPKKLTSSTWERLVSELRSGADKEVVARSFKVSVVTVTRVLRTVPGLQDHWHVIRLEHMRAKARAAWVRITGMQAYAGIKALRRLQPAAYAWLYRNDREWLNACSLDVPAHSLSNHADKRIENADERMANALKNLATRRPDSHCWTLDALKRSVPRIEKAVRFPERWPLTVKTLAFILTFHPTKEQTHEKSPH
jgi:Tn7-like transposition protein D/TniQ